MKINKPKFWDKKDLSIYSLILLPIAFIYQFLLRAKYFLTIKRDFSVPIICIGNIYIGGTGKTPISIKIFQILKELKFNPVIIKKIYNDQTDEELLLKKYSKTITVKKRVDGVNNAIKEKFDVIILDDGYQDLKINKKLNIVCFNLRQKIGNGLTIPAGPLRENLKSLRDCDIVFLNGKKDVVFEKELEKYNRKLKYIYFEYTSQNIAELKNKKLIAFAGIGNPKNFFEYLKENNLNIIKEISYPDHYDYSEKDLKNLIELKEKSNAVLVTTEKDYLRISPNYNEKFQCVKIETKFHDLDSVKGIIKSKIL